MGFSRLTLLLTAMALLAALWIGWLAHGFVAQDRCLDAGGSWISDLGSCDFGAVPTRPRINSKRPGFGAADLSSYAPASGTAKFAQPKPACAAQAHQQQLEPIGSPRQCCRSKSEDRAKRGFPRIT